MEACCVEQEAERGDLEGLGGGVPRGRVCVCVCLADALCHTAETDITL